MSNYAEILQEEFEVLESIYPDEIEKTSEQELQVTVEPDEQEPDHEIRLLLKVHYPPEYPDVVPDLAFEVIDGELSAAEEEDLLEGLRTLGEESLGMAMVFTLVSHLREALATVVADRIERQRKVERDRALAEEEAEAARTRGTPVTTASFLEWKEKFNKKMKLKATQEEEEKTRGMTLKEKEEYKKMKTKPSGRQLFERDRNLATSDATLVDEDAVSVDVSQYDRTAAAHDDEEDEEDHVRFSDSE